MIPAHTSPVPYSPLWVQVSVTSSVCRPLDQDWRAEDVCVWCKIMFRDNKGWGQLVVLRFETFRCFTAGSVRTFCTMCDPAGLPLLLRGHAVFLADGFVVSDISVKLYYNLIRCCAHHSVFIASWLSQCWSSAAMTFTLVTQCRNISDECEYITDTDNNFICPLEEINFFTLLVILYPGLNTHRNLHKCN